MAENKAASGIGFLLAGVIIGFFGGLQYGARTSRARPASPAAPVNAKVVIAPSCPSPETTAKGFLEAVARQDWDGAVKQFPRLDKESRKIYDGVKIVGVGQSIPSETTVAVYVPYEIAWKSGMTRKSNLVLRYIDPAKCFVVEGGF